jgi:hypothetical protein
MNPNYNILPCFVEKNPKTTLKIYVISKQSLWFSIASTSSSSYSSFLKKLPISSSSPPPLFSITLPLLNHPKSHHYDPKQQEFKI